MGTRESFFIIVGLAVGAGMKQKLDIINERLPLPPLLLTENKKRTNPITMLLWGLSRRRLQAKMKAESERKERDEGVLTQDLISFESGDGGEETAADFDERVGSI